MKLGLIIILALLASACSLGQFGFFRGSRPGDLGVKDGRLKPPSNTPNSVSSQADLYPEHPQRSTAQIEPLPLKNASVEQSMAALSKVLLAMPEISLVETRPDYVSAQAQTRWMKFVDDLEFWANPARSVIDVRSASRLGRSDLGANRTRIEAIRAAYLSATP